MGKGIDLARGDAPEHAEILDDFKDQLIIVMLKRLEKLSGTVNIPMEEMDDTGNDMVAFSIINKVFKFEMRKKS